MVMFKLGVIGGGAMGAALIGGVIRNGLISADKIGLVEVDQPRGQALQSNLGIQLFSSVASMASECQTIILAIKPIQLFAILTELGTQLCEKHLVISIAAGVPLAAMENSLPQARIVRVMPNTPARIGKGVSAYCLGQRASGTDAEKVEAIFGCVGKVLRVSEDKLDAVTAVSGSGPAYVYYFIDALINAGVYLGLPRKDAAVLATETVLGAAELLKNSGEHPHQLMNEVTSPGGTTAAALFEFEKAGFAGLVMQAAIAAAERSREIGKGIR
jgi:pyrroline-5-carboxylate reductase